MQDLGDMRQKTGPRRQVATQVEGSPTPIDPADTARHLALFETGNGLQHGVVEIVLAVLAAVLLVPLRSFLRSGSRGRR